MWTTLKSELVNRFPTQSLNGAANGKPMVATLEQTASADGWKRCIDNLLEIRLLEDDWDGQGTEAPTPELVDSAIILAVLLRQAYLAPPCRTVQSLNGGVILEWQWHDQTTFEIEVVEPFVADVYQLVCGQPPQHWQVGNSSSAPASAQ